MIYKRCAIIGSRDAEDLNTLTIFNAVQLAGYNNPVFKDFNAVVSGGARGVDKLARAYAEEYKMFYEEYPVLGWEWNVYGKNAGLMRNKRMLNKVDMVIAVWNGYSRGTNHGITIASELKLPVFVYPV
jgi:hypothetical protein